MTDTDRIARIAIDDRHRAAPSSEIEQERGVAILDLLEENSFALANPDAAPGPYDLHLSIRERRLVFDLAAGAAKAGEIHLSLGPFKQVIKDYWQICEAYFDAVKKLQPGQVEAIDMARRGIHNEGARVLQERLTGKAVIDTDTARRLFTLICVLHDGG